MKTGTEHRSRLKRTVFKVRTISISNGIAIGFGSHERI